MILLLGACSQAPVKPAPSAKPLISAQTPKPPPAAKPAKPAPPPPPSAAYPEVAFETSLGTFVVQLDRQRAPLTVKNFLHYVQTGFYDGTIFHRVLPGFVIQGGGFTPTYVEKPTAAPIPNESGNGLFNLRGTVAMARENDPHSATAQFYINLVDNHALDPRPDRWGYAVFGQVVQGMDVVDKIAAVPTGKAGPFDKDAPLTPVVILKARLLKTSLD
ncbi:MAG: peptidyl-prolyl cis-trans isomerase [Gammaproteobacteria bacterium]|nr:peptidyl-prolyl cis-trans isomerase [Gammaproteobacteria bacterium]MDE2345491.1 peptidyl-prolyl cis-trans isomerase [Gammaproteobacteria bacterium]